MPSIDVIVPCYRYAHYLRECVMSVLAERDLAVRVIILDDASPDNTPEVAGQLVREDSRVTYRRHAVNKRHIATYNEGIEWATADYVLLLSADDYMLPGAIRRAVDFMEAHPKVTFIYSKAILTPDGGLQAPPAGMEPGTQQWRLMSGQTFIQETIDRGTINIVPTPTAIVRTALQKKLGGYVAELPHSADMEMWLRLAAHGEVGEYDGYLAVWRRHESNMQLEYYASDYRMSDLQQRGAAIECFVRSCGDVLPDAEQVRAWLMAPLAHEAMVQASGAFNDGRGEELAKLVAFATEADPGIKRSPRGLLLGLKRLVGMNLWRALYPEFMRKRKRV